MREAGPSSAAASACGSGATEPAIRGGDGAAELLLQLASTPMSSIPQRPALGPPAAASALGAASHHAGPPMTPTTEPALPSNKRRHADANEAAPAKRRTVEGTVVVAASATHAPDGDDTRLLSGAQPPAGHAQCAPSQLPPPPRPLLPPQPQHTGQQHPPWLGVPPGQGTSAAAAAASSANAAGLAAAQQAESLLGSRQTWQTLLDLIPANLDRTTWLPPRELFHSATDRGILVATAYNLRQTYAVCCVERKRRGGRAIIRDFLRLLRATGQSFIASVDESLQVQLQQPPLGGVAVAAPAPASVPVPVPVPFAALTSCGHSPLVAVPTAVYASRAQLPLQGPLPVPAPRVQAALGGLRPVPATVYFPQPPP